MQISRNTGAGAAGRRRILALAHGTEGAAALEFAILSPIYFLMMAGMMAYGIYFGAANSVQQIAADAARTAVAGLDPAERKALVASYIQANAGGYVFIDPRRLGYSVGGNPTDPDEFTVVVSYDARALPIWNIYVPLPLPARTIRFTSSIRIGGL